MTGPSRAVATAWVLLVYAFMYLPVAIILLFSLNDSELIAFPLQGFTTRWYTELLADARLGRGFATTFVVALPVATLATLLGAAAALALTRYRVAYPWALAGLLLVPFFIPDVILAVAQLILLAELGIDRGLTTVIASQTVVILPFTALVVASVLLRVDPRIEEAAADLGADAWSAFRRVTLPLMRNGLMAAFFVAFVLSTAEYVLTAFLSGRRQPLSVLVASDFRFDISPTLNALAVLLVVANIALVAAGELIRRRGTRR